jgi:cation:H+ antiporter
VTVLLLGLVALVKGADLLVEHAARMARRLHVSDLVVGLIITAVGTSLPELASSLAASLAGSPGLVIGNVVGSNIANIGLVLGIAALVRPFDTAPKMFDRDGFILVATAAVLFALVLDNRFGRLDGVIFVLVYVAYSAFAVRTDREGVEHRFKDFLRFVFDFEYAVPVARSLTRRGRGQSGDGDPAPMQKAEAPDVRGFGRELVVVVLSLAAVIAGAHFAVAEAVWVADLIGVPENLVGLSLIAVGTSLPELLVSLTAVRRGNAEMVVGNVLGSNIANVLLVLGLSAVVRPLDVAELSVVYTIPIMLFFSIALLYFIRSDWRIGRGQGAIALGAYLAFLVAAFLQGWG